MDKDIYWERIKEALSSEIELSLPTGSPFKATYDSEYNQIVIVPIKTGIPRRINFTEWERFVNKYNDIENGPYNPLRPGHYAQVSFNSSYLIALVKSIQK